LAIELEGRTPLDEELSQLALGSAGYERPKRFEVRQRLPVQAILSQRASANEQHRRALPDEGRLTVGERQCLVEVGQRQIGAFRPQMVFATHTQQIHLCAVIETLLEQSRDTLGRHRDRPRRGTGLGSAIEARQHRRGSERQGRQDEKQNGRP